MIRALHRPIFLPLLVLVVLAGCSANRPLPTADQESMQQAGLLRGKGDDAGAAGYYQNILQNHPDDVAAHAALAEIMEAHGEIAKAEQHYAAAFKVIPDHAEVLRGYGRVLMRQGKAEVARDAYQKALAVNAHDARSWNGLGIAYDFLGQHGAAQKAYGEALDINPGDYAALSNLAHSHVLAGDYKAAIDLLEPHAAEKAAPPALRQNLAEAYALAGKDIDAERVARADLKPDDVRRNMAYYRDRRAKTAPPPEPYADLGSYPTEAMAKSKGRVARDSLSKDLAMAVEPIIKAAGGTPSFNLRVTGFASAEAADAYCRNMQAPGVACAVALGR